MATPEPVKVYAPPTIAEARESRLRSQMRALGMSTREQAIMVRNAALENGMHWHAQYVALEKLLDEWIESYHMQEARTAQANALFLKALNELFAAKKEIARLRSLLA